tara:strand:+ start:137 stop:400 length:264 start_codon:yes stop_codon:yes gene_type:complete
MIIIDSILLVLALGVYTTLHMRSERRIANLEQLLRTSQLKNRLLSEETRKNKNGQRAKKKATTNGKWSSKKGSTNPKVKETREDIKS